MAERILVRNVEDVTDVVERLRAHPEGEILLVLPRGAVLAESRFNFQLLALQAEENGQRLIVESEDERVLSLAAGTGLETHGGDRAAAAFVTPAAAPHPAAIGPVPPFEEIEDDDEFDDDGARTGGAAASRTGPAYGSRFGPWRPEQSTPAAWRRTLTGDRRRLILYGAAAAILLIGIVAVVVLVPSATITLTTSSQQFSSPIDLTAQPGSTPNGISVRTQSAQKQVSATFQATGAKNTPGAKASGTIQYQNHCPLGLQISQGAVLTSQSGVSFLQQKAITVDTNQTQTAPIEAQSDGANGNVAADQITSLQNAGIYASCLKITNPQPTTGGKDAKHQTVITQQDLSGAQAQLQQQAQQSVESQLAAAVRSGEKQSDQNPVLFGSPEFTADHPAGSAVEHFNATLTLRGTSAYYHPAQVSSAFKAQLQSRVPSGRQLTPYDFVAQYQTTASAGGSVEFKGQATGRIAPRLDLGAIQRHLAGSSTSSAEAYLHTLPVSSVSISQSPFPFPMLPFLGSRISVEYVIQQPPAPAPSPGSPPGASQH
ncbi:MAG: baseplate J/gp47 family protein [Candidatus Dormibacteraeota bacterium]|nr:baseplate J/gp47 family protein [Candidatus Dormibacteraeota bacterium]